MLIGVLILLGRLFELQIIFGVQNRRVAEGNRIKKIVNPAPRGIIFDRNKKPLVRNVPVFRLKQLKCQNQVSGCFQTISRDEALKIEIQGGQDLDRLRVDVGRDYLFGKSLAHVLGYLGEASQEEVEKGVYQLGDLLGRTGIEQEYEEKLRGQNGGEIFEVDANGNQIREMGKTEPIAGEDLYLTIDVELSRVAFEALEALRLGGAVVATEARTGQVLVLVSSPAFNPNKITTEDLVDEKRLFFNRAIGGVYPPGSVFKIVTSAAAIEEGKVNAETIYEDKGFIQIGEYTYTNWYFTQYGRTEGEIDLVKAIKRSTDTFFYKMGEWVGARQLAGWGKSFGLGRKTGIDLPSESEGLVPDPDWKEEATGERWFLGNTYHFAIGQADLLATPLQVNMMTSVIANNGKLCQPKILGSSPPAGGRKNPSDGALSLPKDSSEVKECQDLKLKSETLKLIKEGMKEACLPGGTAWPLFNFQPWVACKTGTAEFGSPAGGQTKTHAWLTAFAPVDNPKIVVTALVEAGGEGSDIAAPIVKKVLETYFSRQN